MRGGGTLCAAAVALVAAQPVLAEAPALPEAEEAHGKLVYDAAFFAAFSPANALQMVERVPGFKLDGGNSTVRGFGGAAGNVVINGQRPSSKSDSIAVVLARIPASRVARIEVEAGNAFGSDYASKSQVANVIMNDEGGLAGTLEAKLAREYTGAILPTVSASALLTHGVSTFTASAKIQNFATSEEGFDRLTDAATGDVLEFRDKRTRHREPFKNVALGWAYEPSADRSAHINAKYSIDPWHLSQTGHVTLIDGTVRQDLFVQDHLWHTYEVSGDVSRPLAGGAIKLNLLGTRRHRRNDDFITQTDFGGLQTGVIQNLDDTLDERIVRLAWASADMAGWSLELGGEGDFNRLRSQVDLYTQDTSGALTRVDLPIDQAVVTEYRGEAFGNIGRSLSRTVHLDFGLTFEASRLTVTGDVSARRVLKFLKPNASLDWVDGPWHAELSVQRRVAQLDFGDFVSGADVNVDRVNGGNAELVPQRIWRFRASADRTVLGDGRIKLELGYSAISQVQDRVPTTDGFDAPGNLGNGSALVANTNIDLPLGKVGIKGGRLSLFGLYVHRSVRDPYTLTDRPFSGKASFSYTLSFRQDLDQFAWGVDMSGNTGSTWYRRQETDTLQGRSPKVTAFAEYRPTSRLTVTLGVENLTNAVSRRWRELYAPDRSTPMPFQHEYRERNKHLLGYLSFKRSFG